MLIYILEGKDIFLLKNIFNLIFDSDYEVISDKCFVKIHVHVYIYIINDIDLPPKTGMHDWCTCQTTREPGGQLLHQVWTVWWDNPHPHRWSAS